MSQQRRATLLGLAAVLLWSTVATAFALSLRRLTPVQLLVYSTAVATLVQRLETMDRQFREAARIIAGQPPEPWMA